MRANGRHRITLCACFAALAACVSSSPSLGDPPLPGGIPVPPIPGLPLPPPLGPQSAPPTAAAGAQAAPSSPSADPTKTTSVRSAPDFASDISRAINVTRRAHRLRPLRVSPVLTTAAVAHARALATAGLFTHSWPDGRAFPTWIRTFYSRTGYRTWNVGENLLWSTPGIDGATVVRRWLASPTHREILLSPRWREVGLGVVAATAAPGVYGETDVEVVAAEFGTRAR